MWDGEHHCTPEGVWGQGGVHHGAEVKGHPDPKSMLWNEEADHKCRLFCTVFSVKMTKINIKSWGSHQAFNLKNELGNSWFGDLRYVPYSNEFTYVRVKTQFEILFVNPPALV